MLLPKASLRLTVSGMFSARVGRGRSGFDESAFLINQYALLESVVGTGAADQRSRSSFVLAWRFRNDGRTKI
jgi:hypothetical protein